MRYRRTLSRNVTSFVKMLYNKGGNMENNNQKAQMIKSFEKGVRFDSRGLEEYRDIVIEYGIAKTAEGSARVKLGNTEVLAGVKLMVGTPFPDTPEEGVITVNAEFLPMASPDFESGPPGIDSIELSRVVDRGIRESKAMDLKKLCIKKGEKVWIVSIDICMLNDDGNLLDASAFAALAALRSARFPEYDGEEIDYSVKTDRSLPMSEMPIPITVFKVGNVFFVDPTKEEQSMFDARLTITFLENDMICSLQKGGEATFTIDEIDKMIGTASNLSNQIRGKFE